MATPVDRATSAARQGQKSLAGRFVILKRFVDGVAATGRALATVGETRADEFVEGGAVVLTRFRDYLIDVSDYVIAGEETEPSIDDQIIETIDGVSVTFQVLPTPGSAGVRHSDRARQVWRLHTRQVSE
jgi:hypothetical protein